MGIVRSGYRVLKEEGPAALAVKGSKYITAESKNTVRKRLLNYPRNRLFQRTHGPAVDVMEQDWDLLIILDACRYDIFAETVDIDGELSSIISKGSHSEEFCAAHFANRKHHDTVYVTANGYGARIGSESFHNLIFTDEDDSVPDVEVKHSTITGLVPSTVVGAAVDANINYPNKRMIVHFMQPHMPYLGSRADELRRRVEDEGLVVRSRDPEKIGKYDTDEANVVSGLDGAFREGYITESELREIYVENLEIVLEHVEELMNEVDGKVVITSDHGEHLGENGLAGHFKYKYTEELRIVPWLVVDNGPRPTITEEEPVTSATVSQDAIEERLQNLGYKE
jgi:hypothetical protein